MPMIKKSITVTDQQAEWISEQIDSGHYGNDSELIREALREKQQRTAELEAIRAKLIAAEESGFVDETPEEVFRQIRAEVKAELKANG